MRARHMLARGSAYDNETPMPNAGDGRRAEVAAGFESDRDAQIGGVARRRRSRRGSRRRRRSYQRRPHGRNRQRACRVGRLRRRRNGRRNGRGGRLRLDAWRRLRRSGDSIGIERQRQHQCGGIGERLAALGLDRALADRSALLGHHRQAPSVLLLHHELGVHRLAIPARRPAEQGIDPRAQRCCIGTRRRRVPIEADGMALDLLGLHILGRHNARDGRDGHQRERDQTHAHKERIVAARRLLDPVELVERRGEIARFGLVQVENDADVGRAASRVDIGGALRAQRRIVGERAAVAHVGG